MVSVFVSACQCVCVCLSVCVSAQGRQCRLQWEICKSSFESLRYWNSGAACTHQCMHVLRQSRYMLRGKVMKFFTCMHHGFHVVPIHTLQTTNVCRHSRITHLYDCKLQKKSKKHSCFVAPYAYERTQLQILIHCFTHMHTHTHTRTHTQTHTRTRTYTCLHT